ncbi:hypothetical protein BBOV_III004260 [Babesia bovis T2Bo]|uniref:hypothetical protein n=1 Tax=Babesia bovis T2Bo TaxID=484906 RepID=UPI001C348AEA|nr:hypothetical protein BBOV_III004260 [Babesia bovis T2Bo]EDO07990.2 hypothetical protein BBOV_III004260 [Babesia bovis T2Bo]
MESDDKPVLIAQGAEARVSSINYMGKKAVLKTRLPKKYRHTELDNILTNRRIVAECRAVARLRRHGVYVPLIYLVDINHRHIVYEYIKGETVLQVLKGNDEELKNDVLRKVGIILAKMHEVNVVHGDLTTRNMLRTEDGDICIIDFGLSYVSTLEEDKGVDLYVLERCCTEKEFDILINSYKQYSKASLQNVNKLAEVRLRGRKRDITG